jgi:hypothetical protein
LAGLSRYKGDTDMLETFSAPGRLWRDNIHGHSNNSDGTLSPEDGCDRYRAQEYDFIALTDHFLPQYDFPISDTCAFRTENFTTIPGAEVHAPETSRGEIWHIPAVGLPLDFARTGPDETCVELARCCAEAGAFVAIAHPHCYQMSYMDYAKSDRIAYRASKAAVNKVMQGLAADLHPDGIAVVLVDPGCVQTGMGGAEADLTPCEVAAGIVALAETLKFEQTGKFFWWNGKERAF